MKQHGKIQGATIMTVDVGFGTSGDRSADHTPEEASLIVEFFDREADAARTLAQLESSLQWRHAVLLPATRIERSFEPSA